MANPIEFANYAKTTLINPISAAQTAILVDNAAVFAAANLGVGHYFYLTLLDCASYAANTSPPAQREVVKVTLIVGNTLTVVRGQDGTITQAFAACDVAELRFNAQAARDLRDGGGGGGGGAPVDATYVVMSLNSTLTNERVLTAGANITITDGGANGPVTIAAAGGGGGSGGFLKGQEFTASGTFTVPANVSSLLITGCGGGGGGSTRTAALGGGGGGAGEYFDKVPLICTPGGTITVTIGAGGAGAPAGSAAAGTTGGSTTFGSLVMLGGLGGVVTGLSGAGGGINGAPSVGTGSGGGLGTQEGPGNFGGSSGGGGSSSTGNNGGAGGGAPGRLVGGAGGTNASTQGGGGGGGATRYGIGGAGGNGGAVGADAPATSYGAGGGGAGGLTGSAAAGGRGCDGYLLVQYVA